jgi:hypothetical protein
MTEMFSDNISPNLLVCFTNVDKINKKKEQEKVKLIERWQIEFKNRFGYHLDNRQFVFIDNTVPEDDDTDEDRWNEF